MHPREFFGFSRTKYRLKVAELEVSHLRLQLAKKREHVRVCKSNLSMDLILAFLSHGSLIWLYLIDDRAIDVGNAKLAIIMAELKKREAAAITLTPPPPVSDDEAIARDILSKLDDKQVATLARVADQRLGCQAQGTEGHQRAAAEGTSCGGVISCTNIVSEEAREQAPPPPYTKSDEQATKV